MTVPYNPTVEVFVADLRIAIVLAEDVDDWSATEEDAMLRLHDALDTVKALNSKAANRDSSR